jgi:protein tyrosine phosphatase (PTP) superfamily phosphohydrolase (DUF442 family)
MARYPRGALLVAIVFVVVVVPFVYYRATYAHAKRLRVVAPGRLYRSGQMTVAGFEDAVRRYGIRLIVNLQDEYPDPDVSCGYFDRSSVKETDICRRLGVRYVFLSLDTLPRRQVPAHRPAAIEEMLRLFDDESNYPMLIHCRAGLHRTGCMAAIYRMEYEGWTPEQAVEEMKTHGFGDVACSAANDYVYQYVLTYRRRSAIDQTRVSVEPTAEHRQPTPDSR